MKIISKYKDYYDHLAYQYGADPLIVYNRREFKHNPDAFKHINRKLNLTARCYFPNRHIRNETEHHFKWLCINAKLYLLVSKNNKQEYKLLTPEKYYELLNKNSRELTNASWSARLYPYTSGYEYYIGNESCYNDLVELSKTLQTPVFEIDTLYFGHYNYDNGMCRVPVLADLGIASIIPPEKMFQDISYFISNTMADAPDVKPPVVIDNDLRIEGHGFDLKQSFRHRK